MIKSLTICFTLFSSLSVFAVQLCDGESETSPTSRFTINNGDAFVVDSITGLAWARCVVGQSWNSDSKTCEGEALRLTWKEALQQANSLVIDSRTDWRVPNIKELATIVERKCVSPAKNLVVFPGAPDGRYWSSTPNTSASAMTESWAVGFYNGRIDSQDKMSDFYVRMVRYAE